MERLAVEHTNLGTGDVFPVEGLRAGVAASHLFGANATALSGKAFRKFLINVEAATVDSTEGVVVQAIILDSKLGRTAGAVILGQVPEVGSRAEVVNIGSWRPRQRR